MAHVLPLSEAVAEFVHDGDTVALEGFTHLIPMAAGHETGSLAEVGLDPDTFTPAPILARHLAEHGVDVHAFLPAYITGSGLLSFE